MKSRFSISSVTLLLEWVIFVAEVVVVVVADDTIFSLFFRIVRIVEVDKFNAVPISDCSADIRLQCRYQIAVPISDCSADIRLPFTCI